MGASISILQLSLSRVGREHSGASRSYGFLGTYPPTPCGIATFTAALAHEISRQPHTAVGVVRVGGSQGGSANVPVVGELANGNANSLRGAIDALNRFDVVIVQHEYGIYGGRDGDEVVALLEGLSVPSIVVAHTVVDCPTAYQQVVLRAVADAASAVVVMTEAARLRLCARFGVDESKVVMIPHGALVDGGGPREHSTRPTILSWGLLGPGKGVEWVIDAMAELRDLVPCPHYVIAGRTHPKVFANDGEAYRSMLTQRAQAHAVEGLVSFDATYRDRASLATMIRGADVVVLPYDSHDQVTSGVLVDAIAAGRPVIATAFPHAVELLSSGAGIVVPHCDPHAIAVAVRRVLTEPGTATRMSSEARNLAADLAWPAVADQYALLAARVCGSVTLAL